MKYILLLIIALSTAAFSSDEKPNIILIISDDQGFGDYGFMGSPVAQTPHLDRMASQGLVYTRGYTTPVCSPSLASLLTGKMPRQHGITGNYQTPAEGMNKRQAKEASRGPLSERLLRNSLMLPKALSEAGYLTFQTGKLWNVTSSEIGFTEGMTKTATKHGGEGLAIGRKGLQPIFNFIEKTQAEKKPFFVWYAPMMPHDPHTPPKQLLEKYEGKGLSLEAQKYFAMVEWFDQTCGKLDEFLAKNNLADNTVILYLADNGWNPEGQGPKARAKLTPYELGIRTPIFVRWPAQLKPLRDEQTLASVIDFAPTILKLAGAKAPADLAGLDLMDREAMTARKSLFVENFTQDIADVSDPDKSLVTRVVIDGWSKLLIPGSARPLTNLSAPTELELFDLQTDPLEKTNLASQRPEEVKRLMALLENSGPARAQR